MGFVENLILFLAVQKLWKSVYIWQSSHRLCNVLFFMDNSVAPTLQNMDGFLLNTFHIKP